MTATNLIAGDARLVAAHLESCNFPWSAEADLQEQIWRVLQRRFPGCCWREYRLSERERPDFLINVFGMSTVAVEVKVQGSRNAILRQLGRYAAHDQVDAVVFASARRTLIAAIPATIHDKPIAVAFLAGEL